MYRMAWYLTNEAIHCDLEGLLHGWRGYRTVDLKPCNVHTRVLQWANSWTARQQEDRNELESKKYRIDNDGGGV